MAIGTETEGSLITPSTRQSLYTIKPALGSVPNAGIIPVSYQLDVAGPMCLSVHDTAVLLTVLQGNDSSNMPAGGYTSAMKGEAGWQEIRIGAVDPERFRYNDPAFQTPIPEALDQIASQPPRPARRRRHRTINKESAEVPYTEQLRSSQRACFQLPL